MLKYFTKFDTQAEYNAAKYELDYPNVSIVASSVTYTETMPTPPTPPSPSGLPSGYTEVEYIENQDTAYINTEFYSTVNTEYVLDFQIMSAVDEDRKIIGNACKFGLGQELGYWRIIEDSWSWYRTSVAITTDRHIAHTDNGKVYIDETLIADRPEYKAASLYYPMFLFGASNGCTGEAPLDGDCSLMRLYSCKIYDDGILVRDFVPCINPQNEVGAYDLVNGQFYGSETTDTFVIPPTPSDAFNAYDENGQLLTSTGCDRIEEVFQGELTNSIVDDDGEVDIYDIWSVEIPDCVTSIGNRAFASCSILQSVTMPQFITSIGDEAFMQCGSLQSVTIPDSITSIGDEAFMQCDSLQSVTILSYNPYGVSLGTAAFGDSTSNYPIYVLSDYLEDWKMAHPEYEDRFEAIVV